MQSKQKVTLYIPPELHRKLKIKAALNTDSMSALVEKALTFYMQYPEAVEETEAINHGKLHQVHFCPECDEPMVMREGKLVSLQLKNNSITEEIFGVGSKSEDSGESSEEELVSCL